MKHTTTTTLTAIFAAAAIMAGCATVKDLLPSEPSEPESPAFANPEIPPTKPGSHDQDFSLKRKDYDGTYRITWPTYFADKIGDKDASYSTVNGVRAKWRGWDDDNGAHRPKYTIAQSAAEIDGPALCKLYGSDGVQLGEVTCRVGRNVRMEGGAE